MLGGLHQHSSCRAVLDRLALDGHGGICGRRPADALSHYLLGGVTISISRFLSGPSSHRHWGTVPGMNNSQRAIEMSSDLDSPFESILRFIRAVIADDYAGVLPNRHCATICQRKLLFSIRLGWGRASLTEVRNMVLWLRPIARSYPPAQRPHSDGSNNFVPEERTLTLVSATPSPGTYGRPVPGLLVQVLSSKLGPLLVDESEHRAQRHGDTDDEGVAAVADDEGHLSRSSAIPSGGRSGSAGLKSCLADSRNGKPNSA